MVFPNGHNEEQTAPLTSRLSGQLFDVISQFSTQLRSRFNSACEYCRAEYARRSEVRQERLEIREQSRQRRKKASWSMGLVDKFYMLLNYDPTDAESGETGRPSIIAAITQFLHSLVMAVGVEVGGFLFIAAVGAYCYFAIMGS